MSAIPIPSDLTSGETVSRLVAGDQAIEFEWTDVTGAKIKLSDYRGEKVLLVFYRFALCPFCNLRLNMLSRQKDELENHGLKIIAFIQSPQDAVRKASDRHSTPFPILADYEKVIYSRYGVARRKRGLMSAMILKPLSWLRAFLKGYFPYKIQGDPFLMPAEFLIKPDGTIHTAHYGKDADDHLNFEQVRSFARR